MMVGGNCAWSFIFRKAESILSMVRVSPLTLAGMIIPLIHGNILMKYYTPITHGRKGLFVKIPGK